MTDAQLMDMMNIDYSNPSIDDQDLQSKIYKKKEFYSYKFPERPNYQNYDDLRQYRDSICSGEIRPFNQQSFARNFITPDSETKGLLIFHDPGTGKCVHPDTTIEINNFKLKISEAWDKYIDSSILNSEENSEWGKVSNVKIKCLSFQKAKIKFRTVSYFYRQKVKETMYLITLNNLKNIIITKKHKLYTYNGWKSIEGGLNYEDYIYGLKDDDCVFSSILNIKKIHYDGYVYDCEVPSIHNYFANDFLGHNTCAGINIAEQFKSYSQKYSIKIHVLVPGQLLRQTWKDSLLFCTGNTYINKKEIDAEIDESKKEKMKRTATLNALQYYKIMSHKTFQKKVLGEKISDRSIYDSENSENKKKAKYRKKSDGTYERDQSIDKIVSLNNTLLIVDEAHRMTNNTYGEALSKIIKNSVNLKVILMTATPMKNVADEIVELLNYIRPENDKIDRNIIFTTSPKNNEMTVKDDGIEYLRKKANGLVSYLRGINPVTIPKKIEMGEVPNGLLFTKLTPSYMESFQLETYNNLDNFYLGNNDVSWIKKDRDFEGLSNFAFPIYSPDKKKIIGSFSIEGMSKLISQLRTSKDALNKKLKEMIKAENETDDLLYLTDNKEISGKIFNIKYLKIFSIKFYNAVQNINKLYYGQNGARTAFVYSNLVKVGANLFKEVLIQNGYLEYNEMGYNIDNETKCYFCGYSYNKHQIKKLPETIQKHIFKPATFIIVKGKSSEEGDILPEEQSKLITSVFNKIENLNGKNIKILLGSRVMNEGISLKNVSEEHILDAGYTLGNVDQVMGRVARQCSHHGLMSEDNVYPEVRIYKYAISLKGKISSEELLYKKAEDKYIVIKKVERILKETAVDCPLNLNYNVTKEETEKYKNCTPLSANINVNNIDDKTKICPSACDFDKCSYKCSDPKLEKYYNNDLGSYEDLNKNEIDESTFKKEMAKLEIEDAKNKIKHLYKLSHVHTLSQIKKEVTSSTEKIIDKIYIYKALDRLMPKTKNDFNNFKDVIVDKFGKRGYLISVDKYYIFQPMNEMIDLPMYYRKKYNKKLLNEIYLSEYITSQKLYTDSMDNHSNLEERGIENKKTNYVFDYDYYSNRKEYEYVGIIDRVGNQLSDQFKFREKIKEMKSDKKRLTGLQSIKGAVCFSSYEKSYLESICKKLDIPFNGGEKKKEICELIMEKMMHLEKYASNKGNVKKLTYMMIPKNHDKYPFPYNLEDRIDYIKNYLLDLLGENKFDKDDYQVKTISKSITEPYFTIKINKKLKSEVIIPNDILKKLKEKFNNVKIIEERNNIEITID